MYVRSSAKDHGRQNTIEGEVKPDLTAVVIEDLVSTGGSSLKAVEELKKNGVIVKGLVSIFSYGFDTATENFKKQLVLLLALQLRSIIKTSPGNRIH